MKKIIYIVFCLITIPSVAYAGWFSSSSFPKIQSKYSMMQEAAITEVQQLKHLKTTPIPKLEKSQERKNLIEKLTRFNSDDKISYVYLINYGKIMAFYTIKGKVSSVNSMLTTTEQLVDDQGRQCNLETCYVVSSPDIDGSYGSNGDAIFFFTTENVYVEWRGDYMLSDQPLKLTTPPELVREIK